MSNLNLTLFRIVIEQSDGSKRWVVRGAEDVDDLLAATARSKDDGSTFGSFGLCQKFVAEPPTRSETSGADESECAGGHDRAHRDGVTEVQHVGQHEKGRAVGDGRRQGHELFEAGVLPLDSVKRKREAQADLRRNHDLNGLEDSDCENEARLEIESKCRRRQERRRPDDRVGYGLDDRSIPPHQVFEVRVAIHVCGAGLPARGRAAGQKRLPKALTCRVHCHWRCR